MKRLFESRLFVHLLGIAGMVNIVVGIFFAIFPQVFLHLFYQNIPDEVYGSSAIMSIVILMFIFILIMGFGYVWSMKDPIKHRLYIFIGGLGKLAAVLVWYISYFDGFAGIYLLIAAINDTLLGLLFIGFYIHYRRE